MLILGTTHGSWGWITYLLRPLAPDPPGLWLGKNTTSTSGYDTVYLEGQGDLVIRLIYPINHIVTLVIPIINPLTKSRGIMENQMETIILGYSSLRFFIFLAVIQ